MLLKEYLTNIANAIRSKLGTADKVNAQDFADKVNEVYDKGRNDEWSDFWDGVQAYGSKTEYSYAFASGWCGEIFYPKYDIKLVGGRNENIFFRFGTNGTGGKFSEPIDLAARLEECGVVLDTSKATKLNYMIGDASISRLPVISTLSVSSLDCALSSCPYIETIDKVILKSDGSQAIGYCFAYNSKLKNITFDGVIGTSANFSWSPLSVESMKSIISCLKNYLGTSNEAKYKVTFTSDCWEALNASTSPYEDGLVDDESIDWQDYVMDSLGWLT